MLVTKIVCASAADAVVVVVGPDAGVGLELPNTKPTISKARLYTPSPRPCACTTTAAIPILNP